MATMTINNHHHHSPRATSATNKMNSLYGGGHSGAVAAGVLINPSSTGNLSKADSSKNYILRPSVNSSSYSASSSGTTMVASPSIYRTPMSYYSQQQHHPQQQLAQHQHPAINRPNIPIVTNKFPINYQHQSPIVNKSSNVRSTTQPPKSTKIVPKLDQQSEHRKMAAQSVVPPLEFYDDDTDESIINFEDNDFCDKLRKIVDRLNDAEYQRLYRLMHQRFIHMSKSVAPSSNVSSFTSASSASSSSSSSTTTSNSFSSSDNCSGGSHSTHDDETQQSNSPVPANYNEEDPHTWPSNWQPLAPQMILAPDQYLRQKPTLNSYQRALIRRISRKHQPLVWKCLKQLAIEQDYGAPTDHSYPHSIPHSKTLTAAAASGSTKQHQATILAPSSSVSPYSSNPSTKTIIDSINNNHHRIFYYYPNQRFSNQYYEAAGSAAVAQPQHQSINSKSTPLTHTSYNSQPSIRSSKGDSNRAVSVDSGADYLKLSSVTPPSPPPSPKSSLPPNGQNDSLTVVGPTPIVVHNNANLSARLSTSMQLNKWSSKMKVYLRKNSN